MNTANLELCKELYELSGWRDTYKHYWNGTVQDVSEETMEWGYENYKDNCSPAYDLGYLLQRLPSNYLLAWHDFDDIPMEDGSTVVQGRAYALVIWGDDLEVWESFYDNANQADTPENAACKLAIELFKQGVLKS